MTEIQTLKDEISRLTRELAEEKECVEDLRAEVERHSNAAAAARLAVSEAMNLICQYRDDMRHPPAPDSRERRVEAIEAVLAKGGRS